MPGIVIVGLGPGEARYLTREAWETLAAAREVYLRTARHPAVAGLPPGLRLHSFDDVYEAVSDFSGVYATIAERILALGRRPEGVVYAVPGHPCVAEATVELIRREAAAKGLILRLVGGLSFIELALEALGVDVLPGLQIVDALDLAVRHHPAFHPDAPALVAQLYSPAVASHVKLTLMNQYPDEHEVALLHALGTAAAQVERCRLFEIDRRPHVAYLTTLYVPPLPQPSAFETLQEIVAHLRAPDGCPWDREQTRRSLRAHLLEETYEAMVAIDADDAPALREELGDVLLQVVLQSQMAVEAGEFSMAEVIAGLCAKLVRRHPHVFDGVQVSGAAEVLANWEKLKTAERNGAEEKKKGSSGILGSVPPGLPALVQADIYQRRAARVGFDWPDISGVQAKMREEIGELEKATDAEAREEELGDLLFAVVNLARWLEVDPESALRRANAKFAARFAKVAAAVQTQGRNLHELKLAELEELWEAAKQ